MDDVLTLYPSLQAEPFYSRFCHAVRREQLTTIGPLRPFAVSKAKRVVVLVVPDGSERNISIVRCGEPIHEKQLGSAGICVCC